MQNISNTHHSSFLILTTKISDFPFFSFQGRTFGKLIQSYVERYMPLNETYLGLYDTEPGRRVYEETLACVNEQYPQYVREIQGTADGSGVPFYKVSLLSWFFFFFFFFF